MTRGLTLLAILLSALMLLPAVSSAEPVADTSGARALAEQGLAAFEANDNETALDLFTRAQKVFPAPPHQIYMARALVRLGRLVEAKELYVKLALIKLDASAPDAFRQAQEAATVELGELEPRIGHLTISVKGPRAEGAVVTLDGKALNSLFVGVARPIDPGSYELVANSDTGASEPVTIKIAVGGREVVSLTLAAKAPDANESGASPNPVLTPEDSSGPNRIPAYSAGAIGLVGVTVGVVFTLSYSSKKTEGDDLFNACNPAGCSDADRGLSEGLDDDAGTNGTIALIGYGVGAVGLATAVILWVTDSSNSERSAAARAVPVTASVRPYASLNQLGLTGTF